MRATGRCPLPADARRRADQVRLSSCRSSSGVIASRLHRSFGAVSDPCARAVCPHQPAIRLVQCTKMQPKTRKPSKAEARKQRNRAAAAAARARKQGTAGGASNRAKPGRCHFSGLNGTRLTLLHLCLQIQRRSRPMRALRMRWPSTRLRWLRLPLSGLNRVLKMSDRMRRILRSREGAWMVGAGSQALQIV